MKRIGTLLALAAVTTAGFAQAPKPAVADTIWLNGPIVTMDDNLPSAEGRLSSMVTMGPLSHMVSATAGFGA